MRQGATVYVEGDVALGKRRETWGPAATDDKSLATFRGNRLRGLGTRRHESSDKLARGVTGDRTSRAAFVVPVDRCGNHHSGSIGTPCDDEGCWFNRQVKARGWSRALKVANVRGLGQAAHVHHQMNRGVRHKVEG
jgi:hypothetical protein